MLRFTVFSMLALSLLTTSVTFAQDKDKGHFYFCGPLNTLMAEGSKPPAPVNKGLAFSITITDGGKTISTGKIDLAIPNAGGPLALSGEVYRPKEILFGADGRVYVFQDNDGGAGSNLCEMYQPF